MAEERIVEVERPASANHTTVIETAPDRGGGIGWLIVVILIVAAAVGLYVFTNMSNSTARKDNAIAAAADNVGKAANQVGDAASTAADKVNPQ